MNLTIDWSQPAELYSSAATFGARKSRYMRFPSAAEAIRFAIEDMTPAQLRGLALECGDDRHQGEAIRALYLQPDYPLQRETR